MPEVLSYNTQYGVNIESQSEWVRALQPPPDIICYQEYPAFRLKDSGVLLPKNYEYEYAPALVKKGQEYGELTAFNPNAVKLVHSKAVDLGVSGLEKMVFGHSGQRSGLVTTFEHEGQELIVANIHLLWLALNSRRREQLGIVIEEFSDPNKPGIIIGDFNYTSLLGGGGLSSFMKSSGFEKAGEAVSTHQFFGISHQLDYVFQRNCTVLELRVEDVHFSDHLPLLFQVQPKSISP